MCLASGSVNMTKSHRSVRLIRAVAAERCSYLARRTTTFISTVTGARSMDCVLVESIVCKCLERREGETGAENDEGERRRERGRKQVQSGVRDSRGCWGGWKELTAS